MEFELLLDAVFADGSRTTLTRIRGRRSPLRTGFAPRLRPLMVTSLGRTGTTWLMRLLSQHPQIVSRRRYPYETRLARYWMQMVKILTEPADHDDSSHPDTIAEDCHWIGHNPFFTGELTDEPPLGRWLGREYPERLARFCQESIEALYRLVAREQSQDQPQFFVEKHLPDHIPDLLNELYGDTREIILVRDFRDMVCSMLAFNRKRGYAAFGREATTSDAEFVSRLGRNVDDLAKACARRQASALLLRYEDLLSDPIAVLTRILGYLGLDANGTVAEAMHSAASRGSSELAEHRTSRHATASIGRWRTELSREMQSACASAFAPWLRELGYPEHGVSKGN